MSMTRYNNQPGNPNEAGILTGGDADRPLRDVVDNKVKTKVFHLGRNAKLFPLLRRGKASGYGQEPLDDLFKQVLATALIECVFSEPGALEPAGAPTRADMLNTKISIFNWKTAAQQLALLNALWAKCYEAIVPAADPADMHDPPGNFSFGGGQLTSSLLPINRALPLVGLKKGPVAQAWKLHGLGFRVDGGKAKTGTRDDLQRVLSEGMKPLATNSANALKFAGKSYNGLSVAKGTHVHLGYQNRDVYNESATCVSRTLLGATAFPYRYTDTDEEGLQHRYLFASCCTGLKGLDTEQWQIDRNASWRPGEKAFVGIPAGNIVGHTRIRRHGDGKGWKFSFVDAAWTWVGNPSQAQKDYLTAELSAWDAGTVYEVRTEYDFTFN